MRFARELIGILVVCAVMSPGAVVAAEVRTKTPIKHVIVVVGQKMSFDHVFATYQPKPGTTVRNLLSAGIIKRDGAPGRNFARAAQQQANGPGSIS